MLFVNSAKPIKVKTELGEFEAGKLSVIGIDTTGQPCREEAQEYIDKRWKVTKTDDDGKKTYELNSRQDKIKRHAIVEAFMFGGIDMMRANPAMVWTAEMVAQLAETDYEKFQECVEAVYKLNPDLKPQEDEPEKDDQELKKTV